jgi:hypothetical protein
MISSLLRPSDIKGVSYERGNICLYLNKNVSLSISHRKIEELQGVDVEQLPYFFKDNQCIYWDVLERVVSIQSILDKFISNPVINNNDPEST